jgi:hypothetical protein
MEECNSNSDVETLSYLYEARLGFTGRALADAPHLAGSISLWRHSVRGMLKDRVPLRFFKPAARATVNSPR